MSLLNIGVSGLIANQASLRTTGQNVSNTNTPGYSRQSVLQATQSAQYSGAGFQGSGTRVETVRRIVDDYAVNQLRLDTSNSGELDSYLANISQIDSLLADSTTGLVPGMQDFFGSLQTGANDPTSMPVRQLILGQAKSLADRFATVQGRLEKQNDTINRQLSTLSAEVSSIAGSLADLNKTIVSASGRSQTDVPNDLLDRRDELIRQLSGLVAVNVVDKEQNAVDIFIGNGQALVVGSQANSLTAVAGKADTSRFDLVFDIQGQKQTVTNAIRGGEIGGMLDFRREVLDTAMNSVGRIALVMSSKVNEQHSLGLDLAGNFGGQLFSDINSVDAISGRVIAHQDNQSSRATTLTVSIDDPTRLSTSDYQLAFPGPNDQRYVLIRSDTGDVVTSGVLSGVVPETIAADGFSVTIESGQVRAGDKFMLQPTRYGASQIDVELERPEQIAFASAINGQGSLSNEGTGTVLNTQALDISTASFAVPGSLAPPILIRFTSPVSYDVLDNTNPSRPTDLLPPMTGLRFTPGIRNDMLPAGTGQTSVTSDGELAGQLPDEFTRIPALTPVTNGYVNEVITISSINPVTGILSVAPPIAVLAGESASAVAQKLSAVHGVAATARTRMSISDFTNEADGTNPMVLSLNGIELVGAAGVSLPDLLTPNALADLISADARFNNMGITASSDGDTLQLESLTGEDLNFTVRGDVGDSFLLTDATGKQLVMRGAGGSTSALVAGTGDLSAGTDFDNGGPYTMTLSVNGSVDQVISLTGNQILGSDVVSALQQAIDTSAISAGDIIVAMDARGQISLETRNGGATESIDIIDVSSAFGAAFGLAPGFAEGAEVANQVTVGGVLTVVMEQGVSLASNATVTTGNLFTANPTALSTYLGYQIVIDGNPEVGDEFTVEYNAEGVSDNRNALSLADIENTKLVGGASVTLLNAYGGMVEFVGASTSQAQINAESSQSLLQQSQAKRDSISGVNLDEEAANLIRFEQAYNASAQVISVARSLFDTLLNTFR
ncbi:MAG: flagellar hook-associated protein 1 FlgK [Candidatus Pseudothioglobus sp.]|jgi:flagellar hook-associated protein 1 FlgK